MARVRILSYYLGIPFHPEYYAFSRCLCTLCVFCVQELSVLQVNSEGQLKVLETDLQAAKATVTSLKDRNKDLGKI